MILVWFLVILLALAWGLADIQLRQPVRPPPPAPMASKAAPADPPRENQAAADESSRSTNQPKEEAIEEKPR